MQAPLSWTFWSATSEGRARSVRTLLAISSHRRLRSCARFALAARGQVSRLSSRGSVCIGAGPAHGHVRGAGERPHLSGAGARPLTTAGSRLLSRGTLGERRSIGSWSVSRGQSKREERCFFRTSSWCTATTAHAASCSRSSASGHREYLADKLRRFRAAGLRARDSCASMRVVGAVRRTCPVTAKVVRYKRRIDPRAVLATLRRVTVSTPLSRACARSARRRARSSWCRTVTPKPVSSVKAKRSLENDSAGVEDQ